eukprot:5382404-Prymnesium_polylepis.1
MVALDHNPGVQTIARSCRLNTIPPLVTFESTAWGRSEHCSTRGHDSRSRGGSGDPWRIAYDAKSGVKRPKLKFPDARLDIKTPHGVGVNTPNKSTPRPWSVRVRCCVTAGRGQTLFQPLPMR